MCEPPKTLCPCPVHAATLRYGDGHALLGENRLGWAELNRRVGAWTRALGALGIAPGDRVMFIAPPSTDYITALWAVFRLGAVACPVNPALPVVRIEAVARLLRPKIAFGDDAPALTDIDVRDMATLCAKAERLSADAWPDHLVPDAPMTIILTSGSTGVPKAAVHCLQHHIAAAEAANRNLPLNPGDRWLLSLPLFHVSGLAILFRCALAGAAVVVPPGNMPLAEALEAFDITHVSLVPTQLRRLLEVPGRSGWLQRMKGALLGGAPLDAALLARAVEAGVPLLRSYGMTETAAQLCATRPGAKLDELLSSGRPLMPGSVRIAPDNGIEVRGPTVFLGYYQAQGGMHRPETPDGWFRTGDTGRFDADGLLHVTGRLDAMFISRGENIHPEEIEAALCALPGIARALVAPVPDSDYGAVPVAFVEAEPNSPHDPARWCAALRQALPGYKIPRHYLPWPELWPATLKPDRAAFAREAIRRLAHAEDNA